MEEFINIVNDSRNCIDIDEKITNLLIDVSGGNLKSAMQLIKELKFQDDVSCNIKEQIKKQLSLLVLQKSIEYDVDATSLLLSKRKEEISYLDDSINLLKEKADEGSAIAQYMLGECYENGIGVTQDDDKAYSLFLSASALGNHQAIYKLALMHRDRKFSISLLNEIKDDSNDVTWAKATLAMLRFLGEKTSGISIKEAIEILSNHEATHFFADLCFVLSYYYTMGEYVDEDTERGYDYLQKAVDSLGNGGRAEGLLFMTFVLKLDLLGFWDKVQKDFDDVTKFDDKPIDNFLYIIDHVINPQIEEYKKCNENKTSIDTQAHKVSDPL